MRADRDDVDFVFLCGGADASNPVAGLDDQFRSVEPDRGCLRLELCLSIP